ncbi:MAG: GTP 3',8-cyclase MoaA [Bacteroidia bacterium]
MQAGFSDIKDRFGRVHDYLRISLTERCNMRCTYCMPEQGIILRPKSEFMTSDEVISIAKVFVSLGIKKIRLTGGEPLIRGDIKKIIEGLSQFPVQLAITTNGILIDQYIDTLKAANLSLVNVSLDSLQPERMKTITRRDYFERIKDNIELLLANNFRVKLNAVIIRSMNDDEIIDFIEFTRERELQYRLIEYMPFLGNNWNGAKGVSFNEMMDKINERYNGNVLKIEGERNETSKNFKIKRYKGSFAIITTVSNPFCDSCNRIRLTADGKIKNCLFSNNETDLLTPLRAGNKITDLILQSVWEKKLTRGGMDSPQKFSNPEFHLKNRSMVAIGG